MALVQFLVGQKRDTAAIQLKLDELIRANQSARNRMLCIEDLTEDELKNVVSAIVSRGEMSIDPSTPCSASTLCGGER